MTSLLRRARAKTVLDVGAGAGHLGAWLDRYAPEVTYRFRESNPRLLDALERRFSPQQHSPPGEPLDGVDALVLLDVIEHVDDDRAFLGDLVADLDPGALLIATVPALPSLFSAWDEAMGHYRRYTRASLRRVVAGLPVQVEECSYLFPELLPAAAVRRVTRPRTAEISPEFPDLSPRLENLLFNLGRLTARVRSYAPAGTSLLIVATRK